MKKTIALTVALAFIFVASIASAATNVLAPGQSTTCEKAGWLEGRLDRDKRFLLAFCFF